MMRPYDYGTMFADFASAIAVAAAVAWSASVLGVPLLVAGCAAGIAFVRIYPSLRRLHAREFTMPRFQPPAIEGAGELALDEIAERMATEPASDSLSEPLPSVRELQASIQRRLGTVGGEFAAGRDGHSGDGTAAKDDSAELRTALGELRRALG